MLRRWAATVLLAGWAISSGGCVAVLAAGGAVAWQGGKAISEEKVTMGRAVDAAKAVFKENRIPLTEEVTKTKATQLRGERPDGANVAVDVIVIDPKSVRLEVRVGVGEKTGARDLLQQIKEKL